MENIEKAKHELEQEKVRGELKSRELELELKREEIALRRDELRVTLWKNPLLLAIIAALIGFLGNAFIAGQQGQQKIVLEKEKRESDLILESIKTGGPEAAARNLGFLVTVGLIDDDEGKIKKYITSIEQVPFLPTKEATKSLTVNCSSTRDCTPKRNCSVKLQRDTRNCSSCLLKAPDGKCLLKGNDPACEIAKATKNNSYQLEAAGKKIDCERIKTQKKLQCETQKEMEKSICEAGKISLKKVANAEKTQFNK